MCFYFFQGKVVNKGRLVSLADDDYVLKIVIQGKRCWRWLLPVTQSPARKHMLILYWTGDVHRDTNVSFQMFGDKLRVYVS